MARNQQKQQKSGSMTTSEAGRKGAEARNRQRGARSDSDRGE